MNANRPVERRLQPVIAPEHFAILGDASRRPVDPQSPGLVVFAFQRCTVALCRRDAVTKFAHFLLDRAGCQRRTLCRGLSGFKRLFSLKQAAEVGKGLVVAALMTWVIWMAVEDGAGIALRAVTVDGLSAFTALLSVLIPTLKRGLVLLLLLGIADYSLARRRHIRDLMMTKQDVKQEHKQSEGDPHQKAKRKAIGRQLAAGGAARGVQKATAVVVNPTHIAVALRYDEAECDAPYIVAKGQEADALKLKQEAKDLGIPVVRDIPLARSLVQFDVGEEVPEELYQAAAALLKVALERKESPDQETP